MKKVLFPAVILVLMGLGSWACRDNAYNTPGYPGSTGGTTPTATPGSSGPTSTPTPRGSGSVTITVSTGTSGASATGYVYTSAAGSNGPDGFLSLTASVGNTIVLPGSSLHPLYFDAGSSTCIYSNVTSNQTYVLAAAGTYYFHCGNHAVNCGGGGNGVCGSTTCTAMAGKVTVN